MFDFFRAKKKLEAKNEITQRQLDLIADYYGISKEMGCCPMKER